MWCRPLCEKPSKSAAASLRTGRGFSFGGACSREQRAASSERRNTEPSPVKTASSQMRTKQRCVRRRALRRLVAAAGSEGNRQQMAGESGERKRLPRRPPRPPPSGGGEEKFTGNLSESVNIQATLMAPKERRGKENSAGKPIPAAGKMKMEESTLNGAAEQTDPSVFFDEDSNHVFPVEQFFGNMDTVQDFSRKSTVTEGMSRREYRRRHYYAKEDSDEEQT